MNITTGPLATLGFCLLATTSMCQEPVPPKASGDPATKPAELHQTTTNLKETLTTNHGLPLSDDQNTLRAGPRGPALLEDLAFREKITRFDHERIPERVVHARGSAAKGYFQVYKSLSDITKAAFLQDPDKKTEVFVRFSTVAGNKGSSDTARDVRGFAVKFYTSEGNYDVVGNNIPVFFIQDAIKFPDLIHAVKMEPDRGFPQAASAHDTFYDFISLTPESMHMMMWVMSDRAIPRSYRMMEGFGVHTFCLVNAQGAVQFVKFHWRPKLGTQSLVWDESVKVYGADPDFHRRDLWEAIERGDFPEWELGLQVFDQATADKLDFDPLDATKIIPEEIVPLRMVGKMVLNKNVDNFHSETEQVAFMPSNLVPGIDFSNDPLLQGRLFSYQDTQITRLGGPNFHQIPVNSPKGCPFSGNFQRDGIHQMEIPKGRVAYEPNSLDKGAPRENPTKGFTSLPEEINGPKVRQRPATFSDHYSQARQFFRSMTEPEQRHIISAFAFELAKVESKPIRLRMLGQLANVDQILRDGVASALGMKEKEEPVPPGVPARDLPPSPPLSILAKAPKTLHGRKIGVLVSDGFDSALLAALRESAKEEKATLVVIAPNVGGAGDAKGKLVEANMALSGAPSVLFDTVVVLTSKKGADELATHAAAVDWVRDAFGHCKVIGYTADAQALLDKAGVQPDDGVLTLEKSKAVSAYIAAAKGGRIWTREPSIRPPG
jgi:catalase